MRKNLISDAVSVAFILLFVYAAASKLIDIHYFPAIGILTPAIEHLRHQAFRD